MVKPMVFRLRFSQENQSIDILQNPTGFVGTSKISKPLSGEAKRSLIVVPCSKASANQRAGRAGRVRHQADEKCPQFLTR